MVRAGVSSSSTTVPSRVHAVPPTSSLAGVVVSSLSARAQSPSSIRLSWQLQTSSPRGAGVVVPEGFRVKYRAVRSRGDDAASDYLVKTVRPGDVTQFLVTGEPVDWLLFIIVRMK